MKSVEKKAIETYHNNLHYFQKEHPELYKRLYTLQIAIEQGVYTEQYALEYLPEGYFDVIDVLTGKYLYEENSIIYSEQLKNTIDKKRTGSVFETQQRFEFELKNYSLEFLENDENIHSSLWATANIIDFVSKYSSKYTTEMKILFKFMILGVGLGLHLKPLIQMNGIKILFIHENNLELFRLSLFLTDYNELSQRCKFYFSIMQSFQEMQTTFLKFLNDNFHYNLYIKFLPFYKDYSDILKKLQSITLSQNYIAYPYQGYLLRYFSIVDKIRNGYCFLNISTAMSSISIHKPILFLASGPSLEHNYEWIHFHQDQFIIATVLSATPFLRSKNIHPDIIFHVDPEKKPTLALLENTDSSEFKNTIFIFGAGIDNEVAKRFEHHHVFYIEESTQFKIGHPSFSTPSIGEYGAIFLTLLGTKNLYLLGLDLAVDPQTLQDHHSSHISTKFLEKSDEYNTTFADSLCYIKGNFIETIPSKPNFRLSITQFVEWIKNYKKPEQSIYNLSNGAFLEGTIPTHIHAIDTKIFEKIDKAIFNNTLLSEFTRCSSCEYRKIDNTFLLEQYKKATYISHKTTLLRSIHLKEGNNYLFKKLIPFIEEISENKSVNKSPIGEIFFEYFQIALCFVFDLFNTTDPHMKKYIAEIDNIVLDEVKKIADKITEKLEDTIKNNCDFPK
nr:6-hydroxymethylpterin diphosphokinase MptE-like protein [Sulfurospirillum sp. 'SP']